ncbi:phage tail protein [Shewanella sp. S23-S33]|uniref:phage tail-collar fiber domain-containing protein n=1 Tax=Shewanella sp. S23-S33 TaxID=3342769 RepID=UPI00372D6F2B
MASVITLAGEQLFAAKAQANEPLDIDTFIFANVPNQDPTAPINREEGIPTAHIVYQQNVQQVGRISDNVVVYSTVLESITGPFEFNWVGLYSSVNQKLVAINHVPTVTKTATASGEAGNTLNRNFGIEYSGIAELTGIIVDQSTWQIDYTARLSGMDLLTQQLAADMNGKDWFIDDGLKVVPRATANTFSVTPGVGYVSGLRVELKQEHILIVQSYPKFVYVDAWFSGNANSTWSPQLAFTVTNGEMDDYIDPSGTQHYVYKLAVINAADDVGDLRNTDGLAQQVDNLKKEIFAYEGSLAAPAGYGLIGACLSEVNLKEIIPERNGQRILLQSVNAGILAGGGAFVFDEESTEDEYGGVIIKPPMISTGRWKRESTENLTMYHFKAYGDGQHDDTQAMRDWMNWQRHTNKTKADMGSGNFLVTAQMPSMTRMSIIGEGYNTNIIVGLNDEDSLFKVPEGIFSHSWIMEKLRFTPASGGSERAKLFDIAGSLRGGTLRDISSWEFTRPYQIKGSIWGNFVMDGVNAYRVRESATIVEGDNPIDLVGNTLMLQNIEIIGAFDKLIQLSGRVFKIDGVNPSGSTSPHQANRGIFLDGAIAGYVRSAWVEQVEASNPGNGEAQAIYLKNCSSVTIENNNISTGSIYVDGGSKNTVRNIEYLQNNGGLKLLNGAKVNVDKSGLGNRNMPLSNADKRYAEPVIADGNNSGKGLLPLPIDPQAMSANIFRSNSSFVTFIINNIDFDSGTKSMTVAVTSADHGVRVTATVVPNKIYTVCARVKVVSSGSLYLAQGANTTAVAANVVYSDRSEGATNGTWLTLHLSMQSANGVLEAFVKTNSPGEFIIDAIDIYTGASTFNPAQLG